MSASRTPGSSPAGADQPQLHSRGDPRIAVTAFWYTTGLRHLVTDTNWTSDTIKVALTTVGYAPDQDAHEFFSSVTSEVAPGSGYTAGGLTLGSRAVSSDAATNQTRLAAANAVWTATASSILARRAVIYKLGGGPSSSPLLGWVDFGADVSATSDTFTIAWDATGVLRITAA